MLGPLNETAANWVLFTKNFTVEVHGCEMLGLRNFLRFSRSPEGVTYIDAHSLGLPDEQNPQLAPDEINTGVAM